MGELDVGVGSEVAAPDPTRVSPAALEPALTASARVFSLGGLSKSCGLPHLTAVLRGDGAAALVEDRAEHPRRAAAPDCDRGRRRR